MGEVARVEAFVDHLTDNRDAYVAFIRGSSGGEPQLIEVYESTRTAFTDRVLEGLGVPEPVPPRLRLRRGAGSPSPRR